MQNFGGLGRWTKFGAVFLALGAMACSSAGTPGPATPTAAAPSQETGLSPEPTATEPSLARATGISGPTPTPTPTLGVMTMEHPPTPTPSITPAPVPTETPAPTLKPEQTPGPSPTSPLEVRQVPAVQEIATIENYAASQFYPGRVVVFKGVPLKLYITRLHREHINRFTIDPFLSSTSFFRPGTVGEVEFTPDQSGEFKMYNVGHGYQGDFIVVDTVDEARNRIAEQGVQEFTLIHDLEGGRIFPSRIVAQKGVLVRIFNTSLKGDERVSIEPFYMPEGVNISERTITTFEFTPDGVGEFIIRYDNHEVTATLVVE